VKEINETLNGYDILGIEGLSKEVNEAKEALKELIVSRESFNNGEGYLEDKKYKNAIDDFLKVIKDDVKYEQAQNYINEIKPKLLEQVKEEAITKKQSNKNTGSFESFEHVKKHEDYFKDNDSFVSMLGEYEKAYYDENIQYINELKANKDYEQALKELETMKTLIEPTDEINKQVAEVKSLQELEKKKRKEQLLAGMSIHYDSMDDITRIAPKGIDPFELNIPQNGYVFFPIIQLSGQDIDNGITAISAIAGFSQDDWIFMDRISFNVDGERFRWDFAYGDAQTEVGWGSIYEWVFRNSLLESNLKDDLQIIANGESVTIRFDGDTNSRDETLSKKQIRQIKEALELYELLNKYGL
jgi:glycerophosphoryl diester phosphodiesterase